MYICIIKFSATRDNIIESWQAKYVKLLDAYEKIR